MLADNRIALNAGWDLEMLKLEISDLSAVGADLSMLGFSKQELASALQGGVNPGLTDENDTSEAIGPAFSVDGDIWCLGLHRIRCGDSTDPDTVSRLLVGVTPRLMVTDPPYGVEYDPSWRHRPGM